MTATGPNTIDHNQAVDRRLRQTYDLYRTSLFLKKYCADRLESAKRWSLFLECALVIGTSSAIATWAVWKSSAGQGAWAMITGVSTILAVLKPILQFPNKIERYTSLYTSHTDLYYDVKKLVDDIQDKCDFTDEMWRSFQHAQERVKELGLKDDPRPVRRLQRKYQEEVNREIPAQELWRPSTNQSVAPEGSSGH